MGLKTRRRVRLHLAAGEPSIEGMLVRVPRGLAGFYELADVTVLETRSDRHELNSARSFVARERVVLVEELHRDEAMALRMVGAA